jgi:hypothetical protein
MEANKLTQYTLMGRHPHLASQFEKWLKSSSQFRDFVEENKAKIRGKVHRAKTEEAFRDIWCEFGIAYLLLQSNHFSKVEYEKYGKAKQAPDFTVTHKTGMGFNVEVRRIRKPESQERFEKWKEDIAQQIRAVSVSTTLAVSIQVEHIDEFDPSPDLLKRLEDKRPEIVDCIVNTIPDAEKNTPIDGAKRYPVLDFHGEVELEFRKPSSKSTPFLSYYGVSPPPWRTQKEHHKFGDIICNKLGQMRAGEINILAIVTDSDTHDEFDLQLAVASLNYQATAGNDDLFRSKKLAGTDDFRESFQRVSGVFFIGPWERISTDNISTSSDPHRLWINQGAECQIPQDICADLQEIG